MATESKDRVFSGSVAEIYQRYMVPLFFEPYAEDIARRLAPRKPADVLEIAAGTGAVTRALAKALPPSTTIIATDLNQPMLDEAATHPIARPVTWRQADAMQLPFRDASFDAVVCQFGAMFFPDRPRAFAEAHRVLRPGGVFLFNVWDRIEDNDFADEVTNALAAMFPQDPPRFMARTPHGYHDRDRILRDVRDGGFIADAEIETVAKRCRAPSARVPATAICQGTLVRGEIEALDAPRLNEATEHAAKAIARRFGNGIVDGKIQAHVVSVTRPANVARW
jgi:SAM-dependent methyltransferase